MAEFAQQSMEEMIPELEQMTLLGLFTLSETSKIMKRRRAFEYKMRKTIKEKRDYENYIQYELRVLNLVKKRRKIMKTTMKRKEIDISIVQRIHNLYKLACTRFSEDDRLWISHIEFCKTRNEISTISHLFTDVLKLHSHKPYLWIMAAEWEMEARLSMENARSLLQRGLRCNKNDKELFRAYYRMELLNAEQLRLRKEVLGLTTNGTDQDDQMSEIHKGEVARIVYQNAVKEIPDAEFCASFLPICSEFPFAASQIDEIYNDLKTQFANVEVAQAMVAKRPLLALDSQNRAGSNNISSAGDTRVAILETLSLYKKAVACLPSVRMWDLYLEDCIKVLQRAQDDGIFSELKELVGEIFDQAMESKNLSENLSVAWLKMLLGIGEVHYTLSLSARMLERFSRSVPLWEIRLTMMINMEFEPTEVWREINTAIKILGEADDITVWKIAVDWSIMRRNSLQIIDFFEIGLKSKSNLVRSYIKHCYLDYSTIYSDIHSVRRLYKRFMAMSLITVDLFLKYIDAELSQENPKMKKIRRQYDFILTFVGSKDIDLWMKYIELEMKGVGGAPELVGQIYYRATKALGDGLTDKFIEQYTLLRNS